MLNPKNNVGKLKKGRLNDLICIFSEWPPQIMDLTILATNTINLDIS